MLPITHTPNRPTTAPPATRLICLENRGSAARVGRRAVVARVVTWDAPPLPPCLVERLHEAGGGVITLKVASLPPFATSIVIVPWFVSPFWSMAKLPSTLFVTETPNRCLAMSGRVPLDALMAFSST